MAETPKLPKPGEPYTTPPTVEVPPPERRTGGTSIYNTVGGGILDGITGSWRQVVSMGFAGVMAFSFLAVGSFMLSQMKDMIAQAREDRLHDRALFETTLTRIQDENNRHTGEIKGAMDVNTSVMRDLIAEIRAARHEGRMNERGALPKAIKPPEDK
jgi:hypothetical protein